MRRLGRHGTERTRGSTRTPTGFPSLGGNRRPSGFGYGLRQRRDRRAAQYACMSQEKNPRAVMPLGKP